MADKRNLRVHESKRHLCWSDGEPFFYLADTGWEFFHRLTLGESATYLMTRAAQGFTTVQCVLLAELDGLKAPNRNGDLPLTDNDPAKPNPAYFDHVEKVLTLAEKLGMVLAMLPTWGDKWNKKWGVGPEIFTPQNARIYGRWLAQRFLDRDVIWVLGGDRPIETDLHRQITNELALGLREIHGGRQLMSYHPWGASHSSTWLHQEAWLDFNMIQSGHKRNRPNWEMISKDYALTPTKPCLDAEPGYEDHPDDFETNKGFLDEWEVRKAAYRSVFAGALGHTYGCHAVWQMAQPAFDPINNPLRTWMDSLSRPGAVQMGHMRRLMESRTPLTRIPDQSLLAMDPGAEAKHVRACRCAKGSWAMIYAPLPTEIKVNPASLAGSDLQAWWFDPRSGLAEEIGQFKKTALPSFHSPGMGPDWILVLDDSSAGFGRPGREVSTFETLERRRAPLWRPSLPH